MVIYEELLDILHAEGVQGSSPRYRRFPGLRTCIEFP